MERVTIKRQIVVKAKATDNLKKKMAAEIQETIKKLDIEIQQLEFSSRRVLATMEKQNSPQAATTKQQIEIEKQKRVEAKAKLTDRLKEIVKLKEDDEVIQGTVDSLIDIGVGDDWHKLMSTEIILLDNKVIEIRQG